MMLKTPIRRPSCKTKTNLSECHTVIATKQYIAKICTLLIPDCAVQLNPYAHISNHFHVLSSLAGR